MTITAKIIADSISPAGVRISTLQLRYPRFIHAEFMTHRMFSRNASSSRAIPVERLIKDVEKDPVTPSFWGKNQPGMQAREELSMEERWEALSLWIRAREQAIFHATRLHQLGAHKQIVNRLLEPFSHITVLVTATEWANFFALRLHPDAQPEMRALAEAMDVALRNHTPKLCDFHRWHTPYVEEPLEGDLAIKVSVARCARVSYLTHEGKEPSIDEDLKLYDRLVGARPLHASPAEHAATPDEIKIPSGGWTGHRLHGNFVGWMQYRKFLPGEYVRG